MNYLIPVDILFTTMLLCGVLACLFFIFLPKDCPNFEKGLVNYFRAYFVFISAGMAALLFREYSPFLLSVFVTNVMFVCGTYCVPLAVLSHYRQDTSQLKRIALISVVMVPLLLVVLAAIKPEAFMLRLAVIYVVSLAVYFYALGLITRLREKHDIADRILAVCVIMAVVAILALPVAYVAADSIGEYYGVVLALQSVLNFMLFGTVLFASLMRTIQFYQQTSLIDPLTGVYNRRHFFQQAGKFLQAAGRHHFPVSIVICDLDHFKKINDSFGHTAGDETLKAVVKVMQAAARGEDIVARYGGEEFVAMLPQTSQASAMRFAERLREEIEKLKVDYEGQSIQVTASFGVTSLEHYTSIESCLKAADRALYRAKRNGRNRVELDDLTDPDNTP